MYEDILKGSWKEIKGSVKEKWGKLTDDDLTAIEGSSIKLVGILQKKYGYDKVKAEKEYNDFMAHHKKAA
ncbi:MAG: CsbD family protein [Nitrospirota bacterium]